MQEKVQKAKQSLEGAQCRQKAYADQRRRALDLDIGSYVKLSTVNLAGRASGTPKLHSKFIGSFQVAAKVGPVAYRLLLPESMKMHNVFDVSMLQPWHYNTSQPGLRLKPSWITKMKARASAEQGHIWSLGEGIHLKMPHGNQNRTLRTRPELVSSGPGVLLPCRNTGTS